MKSFNDFLHKARLLDLGFVGPKYTWTNCKEIWAIIRTIINRDQANADWINIFPETKVVHFPRLNSDHCPILLKTHPNYNKGMNPCRFEPFWMNHHSFIPLTVKVWQQPTNNLTATIETYKKDLMTWNSKTFENILHEIKRTKARRGGIQEILDNSNDSHLLHLEESLQKHLKQLLDKE